MSLWSFISTTNFTVILAYICLILKKFSTHKSLAVLSSDIPSHLSPQMVNSGLMSSGLSGPFTDSSSWEDPLEKEMATLSSPLAWKIPWTEEPARLYIPWDRKQSHRTEQLHFLPVVYKIKFHAL